MADLVDVKIDWGQMLIKLLFLSPFLLLQYVFLAKGFILIQSFEDPSISILALIVWIFGFIKISYWNGVPDFVYKRVHDE